ncbi:MAG: hypothetical protein ACSHX4_04455 [Opitutaceae bacterium]
MKILQSIPLVIFVILSTACSEQEEKFSGVWRFEWNETDRAMNAGYTEKQKEEVVRITLNFKKQDTLFYDYAEMVSGLEGEFARLYKVDWKEDGSFWIQQESGYRKIDVHFEIKESGLLYVTFPLEPGLELDEIIWVFTKEGVNQSR